MFAQQYNWDNSINVLVKRQFTIKAGIRLCDIVSKWKSKWKESGDKAMPMWMDPEVWKGLKVFWIDPHSENKSGKCSKARNTSVSGHGPSRHTSGQKTYARRALESAEKNGGVLPPIVEIMEQTHKRKNGVFIDGLAEQICKEVSAKIAERESQISPGNSDQPGGLSIAEKNNILLEAAPKNKKGRIYGVGSIQVIPSASSFNPPHTSDDYVDRQTYEAERKRNNDLVTRIHGYDYLFDIVAQDSPALAAALRAQRPPTQGAEAQTEEPQDQTEEAATAQGTPQA
ncbi:unnamed protein product [Arabidopsis halleri]